MKKLHLILLTIAAVMLFASSAFAYQATLNVTGERLQSMNAASGSIAAAYYNPVGLVNLADGIYLDLGNRFLGLYKESKGASLSGFGDASVKSEQWGFMLPNFAVAYKKDKGAVFFSLDIRDGGAGGEWAAGDGAAPIAFFGTGSATLAPTCTVVEGLSFTLAYTAGASYQLTDMVAVSGSFRAMQLSETSTMKFDGTDTGGSGITEVESVDSAYGFAPVLNVMVTPLKDLNISLQWQGSSTLKGTNTLTTKSTVGPVNSKVKSAISNYKEDYLMLGVGYTIFKGLDVSLSYTLEFGGELKLNDTVLENANAKHTHKVAAGAQYQIIPLIAVSGGFSFATSDTKDMYNVDVTNASYNQINFGAGVVITPLPNLNIEIGFSDNYYLESKAAVGSDIASGATHNQNAIIIGFGANYKI